MASAIVTGSPDPGVAATGHGAQRHILWAPNQSVWWSFYLTSTNQLSAKYSGDGTTWTAPTGSPFTLSTTNLNEGRNFGFFCKSIASTDVLHIIIAHPGASYYTDYARFTLGTTWTNTDVDAEEWPSQAYAPAGSSCILSEDDHRFDVSVALNGNPHSLAHPNADAGTSWTYTSPTVTQLQSVPGHCTSTAVASLGTGNVIAFWDNANSALVHSNINWSAYTGTWSAQASVFASDFTDTSNDKWAICNCTTSDVHCVALTDNSNTFGHRRFNGSSWSDGNTVPTLTLAATSGLALVSDGTNVWLWAIDSSGNIQYCKWSGSSWGSWTVQEATRSNSPAYVTAAINGGGTAIQVAWTETNGSNYEIWTSHLALISPPTTATLSGPTSGALDAKSTAFTVTLDQPAGVGGVIVTPSSTGANDTFSAS